MLTEYLLRRDGLGSAASEFLALSEGVLAASLARKTSSFIGPTMHAHISSAAVLYAKDLGLLSEFYAAVADMAITESEEGHVVLEAHGFQLVVIAIPQHIAATIQLQSPPVRREDTPIKLVFFVPSIEAASTRVAQLGGQMNPSERTWQFQGLAVLDGHDPEGNVFQLRQRAHPQEAL